MTAITALCIISASEIQMINPDFTYDWVETNKKDFDSILHNLGMDVTQTIERQENIQHVNRMNKVVVCDRWVGYERTDKEWIESGYASKSAKDKASGNKLLEDLYRRKGLVE